MGELFTQENNVNNTDEDQIKEVGSLKWKKVFKRIFSILKWRIPLWLITLILIFALGFWGYRAISSEDPVNLRPIVEDSQLLDISITLCNEKVDELDLDVRDEELKFQDKFEKVEKVKEATVEIKRRNCKNN